MEDLDLLYRAKGYIDKLANGINPLTDEPVGEEDVVNNVRIARCFFYVSDVLRKVIENGGRVRKRKRSSFYITDEELAGFEYSDEPIALSQIIERINGLIDPTEMKKLSRKIVLNRLKEMGLIEDAYGRYGKAKTCPTETGSELGLTMERRMSYQGEYYATYYNRNAQEFVINNIEAFFRK